MIQILLLTVIIVTLVLAAKRFFPSSEAELELENYRGEVRTRGSREELAIVLSNLQRWRKEGRISREEYDRLTDICLQELRKAPPKDLR